MSTEHYEFSEDRTHLVKLAQGGSSFAPNGKVVLAVVLPGDVTHLINYGDRSIETTIVHGVLHIQGVQTASAARSYKTWLYHEKIPYKARPLPQARVLR
ncbi:hypothetical protein [Myceligenerans crystallogenes]|uniref:Uncharacterized protein n=1 Tax=Myceligenerans crystallogenes TaxID=316335 RepID=A0ABN2NHJ5_9MICO